MDDWEQLLTAWYRSVRRDLPWRHTHDPYRVWISEIMLQQTRVETVIDYYERFLKRFPRVHDLAQAPLDDVLKMWEGLGYYSRARNLHKAAQQIAEAGTFPEEEDEIRALAGIGDYTAGAIRSIAFNRKAAAVDGNVLRVISRLYGLDEDITTPHARKVITKIVLDHVPEPSVDAAGEQWFDEGPNAYTQGLMELGATTCLPSSPACGNCPLKAGCRARIEGTTEDLPVKKKSKIPRTEQLLIFLLRHSEGTDTSVLMHRRPENGLLKGLWEYPHIEMQACTQEENEHPESEQKENEPFENETMIRLLTEGVREQYGITLDHVRFLMQTEHLFSHIRWKMTVFTSDTSPQAFLNAALSSGQNPDDWAMDRIQTESKIMIPTAFQKIRKFLCKTVFDRK